MELLLILFLIILNGIFSMSEVALISAKKNRLEALAKKGSTRAKTALELANSPNKFLSTVQIGITLIGILTGIYSGQNITDDVHAFVENFEALKPYADSISVGAVVIVLTFFSLVLGELVPKRIGMSHPETIAKIVAVPMKFVSIVAAPFIWLLIVSTEFLLKTLTVRPSNESKVTEEEIRAIIKEGAEGGEVQEIEQDIVERVFFIGDRYVTSLMTHRKSVVLLPLESDKEQVKTLMLKELHSIYPVYNKDYDDIVGAVDLKGIFAHFDKESFNLKDIIKEAPFIMEKTTAYVALDNFKQSGIHYAFVMDEYGVFQGIITLNDILEALVGTASDFYKEEFQLVAREDGTWLVDGHYSLHDFLIHFDLEDLINQYDVDTVSGLIMVELSRIPKQGDKLVWKNFELEIIDMDGVKIDKVMVKSQKKTGEE